ncbi:MAG: transposase family protein [Candidatus Hydrogenedentes bacterium]|nr:transposase family protein [Candidatus Hydrogenedentota bacterium]
MFKSHSALCAENLALRHQLCVYQRSVKRPKVRPIDRILWGLLSRVWTRWKDALIFVKPDTVIRWQRKRFKEYWRRLSTSGKPGRPPVAEEVKNLIRTMSSMNPTWGSPRIVGELAKLGITVTKSTVDKYRVRVRKPPSPSWRAFLKNHMKELVSVDFLVVPTVRFKILYVFLVLSIERRRIIHFAITQHPTAAWTAQQVVEAFPWDTAPKYLLRDRDKVYGGWFKRRVRNMGIEEVLTAPHSPWQNPYSERLNGSIRRECLDHVIVFGENHLRRIIGDYVAYYNGSRTHLSLDMDSPDMRPVQMPDQGKVISLPQVGGLHHRYERRAA